MSTCLEARQGDECGSPDHDDHVTSQKRGLPSCKVYFIINTQQEEKKVETSFDNYSSGLACALHNVQTW